MARPAFGFHSVEHLPAVVDTVRQHYAGRCIESLPVAEHAARFLAHHIKGITLFRSADFYLFQNFKKNIALKLAEVICSVFLVFVSQSFKKLEYQSTTSILLFFLLHG